MGFAHDREWMVVDESYRFLTQREEPRLALITPQVQGTTLTLDAPERATLTVRADANARSVETIVWRDRCAAFDCGEEPARWLSEFLGRAVRLVHFDQRGRRASSTDWTGDTEALNQFSDGFPWLVISQPSLDDLNLRLPEPLPMNRFRPNIVLADVPAYAEDRIHELVIGSVRLRLVKPCTRCAITTTDQSTGERRSDQPLRTLKQYRFDKELRGVLFGQNAILIAGAGEHVRAGENAQIVWKS
jgi:uncharacterized protein YcbX